MSEITKTLFLYAQITVASIVFFRHRQNYTFVRTVIFHAIGFTILLSLIQYGSAYSLDWDYSRWQWSNEFQIFPLRGSGNAPGANTIPKTSFAYWVLTPITSLFYVAFPQAILIAENKHFRDSKKWFHKILSILKKTCRLGIGFFSTAIVLSSLVSPFPCGNKIVLLISYGVLVMWLRSRMWDDIGDGIQGYFPKRGLKNLVDVIRFFKR